MNYKAELKGFCFDRALQYHDKMGLKTELNSVLETTDKLADYFYIEDKDFADAGQHIIELADSTPLDTLAELVNALSNIHDRRSAHAARIAQKVQDSLKPETAQ